MSNPNLRSSYTNLLIAWTSLKFKCYPDNLGGSCCTKVKSQSICSSWCIFQLLGAKDTFWALHLNTNALKELTSFLELTAAFSPLNWLKNTLNRLALPFSLNFILLNTNDLTNRAVNSSIPISFNSEIMSFAVSFKNLY